MKHAYPIIVVFFLLTIPACAGRPGLGSVAQLDAGTVICRFVPDLMEYRNASYKKNSFAMNQMVSAGKCKVLSSYQLCTVSNYERGRTTAVTLHSNGKLVVVDRNAVKSSR